MGNFLNADENLAQGQHRGDTPAAPLLQRLEDRLRPRPVLGMALKGIDKEYRIQRHPLDLGQMRHQLCQHVYAARSHTARSSASTVSPPPSSAHTSAPRP
jgi:hypothetical protein